MESKKLQFGIDCFLQQKPEYNKIRFGLVNNNAATTSEGAASRTALLKAGFRVIKLFSPEHGLAAQGEDGAYQKNIIDPLTQLPVISLYAEKLMPDEKDLADIDALLFDIPDVGCRFYTYLWTMAYVMEACAAYNKTFILLDRPNPISGNMDAAEGPMLDERNCSSFIGRWSIPVRHSCTLGELASYFAATRIKNLDLIIIRNQNWGREVVAKEVNWFFRSPSPAITDVETALLYPAMGLLEGVNVNEGRGTATPFKIFGAPWINTSELQKEFLSLSIKGINSQPLTYKPLSRLYANEVCQGLQLSESDAAQLRPVNTGLQIIRLLLSLYPNHCSERLYKTNVNPAGQNHLDKLTGVEHSFEKLKKGEMIPTDLSAAQWKTIIDPYLIY